MKNTIALLTLLISFELFAATAMVIAHRAPMFKAMDPDAVVYQYVYKGEKIFINNKHIDRTFLTNYRADDSIGKELVEESEYYTTSDRIGRTAYILKRHVKIIYNDTRELDSPVSMKGFDETDYRIKGKLPRNYPFKPDERRYSTLLLGTETTAKNSYPYPNAIEKDTIGNRYKIAGIAAWKADFDLMDRFYFGAKGEIAFSQNQYFFEDSTMSNEANLVWSLGPYLSYDFYKSEKNILRLGGGILLNYHLMKISQDSTDGFRDRQYYSAFFLTPEMGLSYVRREIMDRLDLVLGSSLKINSPYSLTTGMTKYEQSRWNSTTDQVEHPLGINVDLCAGLSYRF